jgi:hypothetical protein
LIVDSGWSRVVESFSVLHQFHENEQKPEAVAALQKLSGAGRLHDGILALDRKETGRAAAPALIQPHCLGVTLRRRAQPDKSAPEPEVAIW